MNILRLNYPINNSLDMVKGKIYSLNKFSVLKLSTGRRLFIKK